MSKRPPKANAADAPRVGGARAVSELLPRVGGAAFRKFGFVQSAVVSRWAEIVGERYARVSSPESIRFPIGEKVGGTLTLVVQGAHAVTMQHVLPEIMERVNRFFGYAAVAKVAIRQGQVAAKSPPRVAPPSLKPVPAEQLGSLGNSLRAIADPELKAVLSALAAGVATTSGAPVVEQDQ